MNDRNTAGPDADISDWTGVSPYELISNPLLLREKPPAGAAARALKYSRAGDSDRYDEIGFRFSAATAEKGPVPLQTIAGMRLEKEWAERTQIRPELEELIEQQRKLRHRPLDLPLDGHFRYAITRDTLEFALIPEPSTEDAEVKEEIWSFPLTAPPSMLLAQGVEDRDAGELLTQRFRVDIPCNFWLPVTALIEAGELRRMQEWPHQLSETTAPGCFYGFVSHRWLSPGHPDPERTRARFIAWQLFSHLCEAVRVALARGLDTPRKFSSVLGRELGIQGSSLAESLLVNVLRPTRDPGLIAAAAEEIATIDGALKDFGVSAAHEEGALRHLQDVLASRPILSRLMSRIFLWYDYSCMPQPPRNEDEDVLFRKGLESLNAIQLLGRTLVVLDDVEDYMTRAWCTLEAILADSLQTVDLMIGSQRPTAREGLAEIFFENVLEDRPHILWRALLDTEVFKVQTPGECMARLGLKMTDARDLPYLYERLRSHKSPVKVHLDDSELFTGVVPLPLVDQGRSVLWTDSSGHSVRKSPPPAERRTLDWTDALDLKTAWDPQGDDAASVPPFLSFDPAPGERRPRCHVAVIGSCEGEAVMLSNWARKQRAALESLLDVAVASLTWVASDIAPVGHFIRASLTARAVDADVWVILAMSTRLAHGSFTGLLIDLLQQAGRRAVAFAIDDATNNVWNVEPASQLQPFVTAGLPEAGFPVHSGGLFRKAVVQHLLGIKDRD